MRNLKTNLLMAVGISLFSTQAFATSTTCTSPDRCADLGYTKDAADCPNGGIRCPFDTSKYYCGLTICNVGDIHFTDGACSPNLIEGKTADGVFISSSIIIGLKVSIETWDDAKVFCTNSGSGWRLPTPEEIISVALPDNSTTSKIINASNTAGFVDLSNYGLGPIMSQVWTNKPTPDGRGYAYMSPDFGIASCGIGDCQMPGPSQPQSAPAPVQCVKTVQ